ncbi:class I SAM-dependent methyltransferase [Pyrinomonas methylaliphatogenes]|uniref:Methylase involved in ubiquinone/menaquinone biosynthesis n=1 Tax=Pyrinomonas methylaliphatogenes TaxID=454194 RepID=A0A0B6WXF3_9BACT|nr:class I SAM-dependent methyltransferase [Pyrinomonas methylaliphatogenes]CDM64850.1 methylase involved in ubiquinone/menaquinone biosynthesis [Pyrinomonas methylaliphatogenes]
MNSEDYKLLHDLENDFWWFVGMRAITASLLDQIFSPRHNGLILDAGCGTGGNLQWLARYRSSVVGLDLSDDALRFCRESNRNDLIQASVADLPFADETFDLVTSFDVLVQLKEDDAEKAVREMHRVLRGGGVAFVRVAAFEWMRSGHDVALGTQKRYRLDELTRLMERAGFEIARATYANALLLPVAAVRRLILKRIGLADAGSDVKPLCARWQWLNRPLTRVLAAEAHLLRRTDLRFGLSAICIARKKH